MHGSVSLTLEEVRRVMRQYEMPWDKYRGRVRLSLTDLMSAGMMAVCEDFAELRWSAVGEPEENPRRVLLIHPDLWRDIRAYEGFQNISESELLAMLVHHVLTQGGEQGHPLAKVTP